MAPNFPIDRDIDDSIQKEASSIDPNRFDHSSRCWGDKWESQISLLEAQTDSDQEY